MKKMLFIILLFLFMSNGIVCQSFQPDSSTNISKISSDDLYPSWSQDDSKLLFQSFRTGNWDIFLYDLSLDTTFQLTNTPDNEQHPVWQDDDQFVVFNSDQGNEEHIYTLNLKTNEVKLLFNRRVQAREPSFPKSELLVYFSGFDELDKHWKIYSYEFLHNNLNQLTKLGGKSILPKISKNGNDVVFLHATDHSLLYEIKSMNWYGNIGNVFHDIQASDLSWGPTGLKIYFVSKMDHQKGEVYSIWSDGTHLERLTNDDYEVRCPAVSNNGKFVAMSVLMENGYDLFIISLDNY